MAAIATGSPLPPSAPLILEVVPKQGFALQEGDKLLVFNNPFVLPLLAIYQTSLAWHFLLPNFSPTPFCRGIQFHMAAAHVAFYAAEILLGLDAIHSAGVACCHFSARSVVMLEDGHVAVAPYMPVFEQLMTPPAGSSTGASDWFSFGSFICELLLGSTTPDAALLRPESFGLITLLQQNSPHLTSGEISSHAFFSDVDWSGLVARTAAPPFKPQVFLLAAGGNAKDVSLGDTLLSPNVPNRLEGYTIRFPTMNNSMHSAVIAPKQDATATAAGGGRNSSGGKKK
jgi:hypothetical protein